MYSKYLMDMINNQMIQTIFQQKQEGGFIGKELVKEVIKEIAKDYKRSHPYGDNIVSAVTFHSIIEYIGQETQRMGISISKREILAEIAKGMSQP